jgi:hypothetical protein
MAGSPTYGSYEFEVESADGASRGAMTRQPALPEPGDVLELFDSQGAARYYKVRTRRFTEGGRVTVVVDAL